MVDKWSSFFNLSFLIFLRLFFSSSSTYKLFLLIFDNNDSEDSLLSIVFDDPQLERSFRWFGDKLLDSYSILKILFKKIICLMKTLNRLNYEVYYFYLHITLASFFGAICIKMVLSPEKITLVCFSFVFKVSFGMLSLLASLIEDRFLVSDCFSKAFLLSS